MNLETFETNDLLLLTIVIGKLSIKQMKEMGLSLQDQKDIVRMYSDIKDAYLDKCVANDLSTPITLVGDK